MNNSSTAATIAVQCPDVSVLTTDNPTAPIVAGASAGFTIVVTAGGTGPSTAVVLTDPLPNSGHTRTVGGTRYSSGTGGPTTQLPITTLTCNFGTLPNGATKQITLST